MSRPEGLFLVTDKGLRIPIDLKFDRHENGVRYWAPVIEGDLDKVMPSVVAFDGPPVDAGECITLVDPGPGWDSPEWGGRVMANSRHVFAWYEGDDGRVVAL